ncbi:hypothetical protein BEN47_06425 [Hymenobacter lapidarius]|uniref:Uncharacterized protein n=1 Tax=Hymenobacter lapidarius TaxID=1908237 RepID=A0A1G1SQJ4_9BACT|nr:hypothetical protein BEN47_06425 [Hymenobacter lapidarius]
MAQQSPPPAVPPRPDPGYQEVSVPVPRAVTLITDVAKVMLSRDDRQDKVQTLIDKRRARSEKREQSLTITIPRNAFTRTLGLVD